MDIFSLNGTRRSRSGPRGWVAQTVAAFATTDARRRDQARLAALADGLLADIGLTRDAVRARRPDIG